MEMLLLKQAKIPVINLLPTKLGNAALQKSGDFRQIRSVF